MPLEPPTPGSPEDWLRHARSDLALAQQWQVPDVLLAALCFHAQQTVEKSLKAVLVHVGALFRIRMILPGSLLWYRASGCPGQRLSTPPQL